MIHPRNDTRYDSREEENRIRILQEMLRDIGTWEDDPALYLLPSGTLDPATRRAIRQIREEEGLPPGDGIDEALWEAVRQRYEAGRQANTPPAGIYPLGREMRTLRRGEQSDLVLLLQILLGTTRLYYDTLAHVPLSGVYDEATEEAVRELQRLYLLSESGEVDLDTWNRLAEDYSRAAAENQ